VSRPKVDTVNVVTMESGHLFVKLLFGGENVGDACDETKILIWPGEEDDADDPSDAETESFHALTNDICRRVYEAVREQVAETFVRVANAAIEEERTRPEEPLNPPRVTTVDTVTQEQGLIYAEHLYRETVDTEIFGMALSATQIMTFPDDGPNGEESAAQTHFHDMTDEIRDRIHEETKQLIADAFVRIVSDVVSRERQRR